MSCDNDSKRLKIPALNYGNTDLFRRSLPPLRNGKRRFFHTSVRKGLHQAQAQGSSYPEKIFLSPSPAAALPVPVLPPPPPPPLMLPLLELCLLCVPPATAELHELLSPSPPARLKPPRLPRAPRRPSWINTGSCVLSPLLVVVVVVVVIGGRVRQAQERQRGRRGGEKRRLRHRSLQAQKTSTITV